MCQMAISIKCWMATLGLLWCAALGDPAVPGVEVDGVKYLVSTRGESQWVKNVRVDPNVTLTTKSGTTKYVANETPVENRQPIFDANKLNAGKIVEVWPRCGINMPDGRPRVEFPNPRTGPRIPCDGAPRRGHRPGTHNWHFPTATREGRIVFCRVCEAVRVPRTHPFMHPCIDTWDRPVIRFVLRTGRVFMSVSPEELYGFATELRKLAYSMPGGHEDPLIRLSERMAHQARHAVVGESPPPQLSNQ